MKEKIRIGALVIIAVSALIFSISFASYAYDSWQKNHPKPLAPLPDLSPLFHNGTNQ